MCGWVVLCAWGTTGEGVLSLCLCPAVIIAQEWRQIALVPSPHFVFPLLQWWRPPAWHPGLRTPASSSLSSSPASGSATSQGVNSVWGVEVWRVGHENADKLVFVIIPSFGDRYLPGECVWAFYLFIPVLYAAWRCLPR